VQAYWTLTRRELAAFFLSITGYVVVAAVAFLVGAVFKVLIKTLGSDSWPMPVTELFYNTYLFWFILLLSIPVITMRLFAHEKFSGTYETLMTTPVSDVQVVAAKFTAAFVFYLVMWLPLLGYILLIGHYTNLTGSQAGGLAAMDWGMIGSTFLGIGLLGGPFIALGCLASALTRSQMVAAIVSLVFCFGVFLLSYLGDRVPAADWTSQLLSFFALPDQMHDFVRGVVDTRTVVLYLTLTFFFLFLTLRVVESRRWK
jgi:ABC-2 type transport system permease protein